MSACKQCGLSVQWIKVGRKWFCYNEGTTTDHWDACSKERTTRIRRTGIPFDGEFEAGYETDLKKSGVLYMRQHKMAVEGKRFKLSGTCKQCVPPWEVCPHGCADEFRITA